MPSAARSSPSSAGGGGSAHRRARRRQRPRRAGLGRRARARRRRAAVRPERREAGTGSAFLGTVGVRFRPLGASRVAGPWIDANGGLAQTGSEARVAVDAHLGWDFRVSEKTRWDVGPFVGFTQIMQSDVAFRPDDAHIALGRHPGQPRREREAARAPAAAARRAARAAVVRDRDGARRRSRTSARRPTRRRSSPDGCPGPEVKLVGDRIVLDDVIHFEFNSPVIRTQSTGLVRKVAQLIVETPRTSSSVSIEGHADARGTEEYNQRALRGARREHARDARAASASTSSRLHVVGHGKSQLLVATPLADLRNRRVEFIVVALDATRPVRRPRPFAKVASGKRGQP